MKNSIIMKIFYQERGSIDTVPFPEEAFPYVDEMDKISKELKEKLTKEQWELHEKFEHTLCSLCLKDAEAYYVEGFKLGVLLGIECMDK